MKHLALIAATLIPAPAAAQGIEAALLALGGTGCEDDSGMTCVAMQVPLDHQGTRPGETLDIHYAVLPASGLRMGTIVVAMGGPGTAGVASGVNYIESFAPEVLDAYDLVFFDQRGIGLSGGLSCPQAMVGNIEQDVRLADPGPIVAMTADFVAACIAEFGDTPLLPFVGTDQAVRDLELFRQALGVDALWLYGESYGTQFAQTYAAMYPASTAGVIIDGVVDLTLDFEGFSRSAVQAAERILARILAECDGQPACSRDMGAPAADVYTRLRQSLDQSPATLDLPLADGTTAARRMTGAMLEAVAFDALYSPVGRADFLRAVAAAGRGDWQPLLLIYYRVAGVDPATLEAVEDGLWFPAAYYAINCMDYGEGAAETAEDTARILTEAQAFAPEAPNFPRSYFAERLVCAQWPHSGPAARPAPFAGGDFPTLILNGDADPITPVPMAYAVLDAARNAAAVIVTGGSHVIWGQGNPCPDDIVFDLLMNGTRPEAPLQLCNGLLVDDYIPLTRTDPTKAMEAMAIADGFRAELSVFPPYYTWDATGPLQMACPFGGTVQIVPLQDLDVIEVLDCAFWPDITLTGKGSATFGDDGAETLRLSLTVAGAASGTLDYGFDYITEARWVTGTLNGTPAGTPRPMP